MTLLIASGMATRYEPGLMERVVENRQNWQHLDTDTDPAQCVALLDCTLLGQQVILEFPDGALSQVTVADCAQAEHRQQLLDRGWAVDLSYQLAERHGVIDAPLAGVTVWYEPRHWWR